MTFSYQPNAAGLSWLAMSQSLDARAQMEKDIFELEGANTKVQVNMTEETSDATLNELLDVAEGQRQSATFTIAGGAAGIVSAGTSLIGSFATLPTSTPSIKTNVGVKEIDANGTSSNTGAKTPLDITAQVDAQPQPKPATPASNSNNSTTPKNNEPTSSPSKALWHNFFNHNATYAAQAITSGLQGIGQLQQAKYTEMQAAEKTIEVLSQGLSTVMNAQNQALTTANGGNDSFFNNTEENIKAMISASRSA